jgi:hypothetical protein
MSDDLYVQYGCGFIAPPQWTNFDSSLTLQFERTPLIGQIYTKNAQRFPPSVRFGDIVKGLPVEAASCKGVYASHVLEHLALQDFHKALENTRRILVKNGIFRLVVPDLETAAREYIGRIDSGDASSNGFFLRETSLGEEERRSGIGGLLHRALNTSKHLWMWDAPSLTQALSEHEFHSVRRCYWNDCEDPVFAQVESKERFENAVAMEAKG